MLENMLKELPYFIGILLSVILGFCIGFERKIRSKEAGIRTHTIVCLGSAIVMVVSKIGFEAGTFDTSRVASSIITGIGFLGAGMIVLKQREIHGLTTAAGVWATAGIGMAAGAGLYLTAVLSAVVLVVVQCVLHANIKAFHVKQPFFFNVNFVFRENAIDKVKEIFNVQHFDKMSVDRRENEINYNVVISTDVWLKAPIIAEILKENEFIKSITVNDKTVD